MIDITVEAKISILQAMKALDRTAEKCLLVVDENRKLLGTLTDGDIRRSILGGANFSENISGSYNKHPCFLTANKYKTEEAKQLLFDNKLDLIPIVDGHHLVLDYITWSSTSGENQSQKSLANLPVVIMAGGKGTRMEPFTSVLPKPLVPIHGKPIIEHIIERFSKFGCSEFYVTLNYKAMILKAFFDELEPDYNVHFIEEKKPLGTAGSLRLCESNLNKPFFLTNCDTIIKTDYVSLYEFHQKGNYDVTLVASAKEHVIPYGTCELNSEGSLSHIDEKPKYDFLINTGLYVINPGILGYIPKNKFYHITHLIERVKDKGKKVGVFPIDDDAWIDVGEWTEYRKAAEKLSF